MERMRSSAVPTVIAALVLGCCASARTAGGGQDTPPGDAGRPGVRPAVPPPYPPSPVLRGVRWEFDRIVRAAPGSDLWPIAWADDGALYTSWGDGGGFGGTNDDGRVTVGVAAIEGSPPDFAAKNVFGGKDCLAPATFTGKSNGILSIGGTLYLTVVEEGKWLRSRIGKSEDHGKSWRFNPADWDFAEPDGAFSDIAFLTFGKGYEGARDGFVYAYSQDYRAHGTGKQMMTSSVALFRAPRDEIQDRGSYEYFAGLDAAGDPLWTREIAKRKAVFHDPNGVGWGVRVAYHPGFRRYLLTVFHDDSGGWGLFDAPEPWGPWTTVGYWDKWIDPVFKFGFTFNQKWMEDSGRTAWMVFSGIGLYDSFNAIKVTFEPRRDRPASEYWVSTTGNDADAGTKERPFATLERARDAVGEARKGGPLEGGVTVWLRGGAYRRDRTFELTTQDSGTAAAPVVYRSAPGEEVRLVGGKRIPSDAFEPVTDPEVLERLDPSARGKVLRADLKAQGITDYGKLTRRGGIERSTLPAALELYFDDRPMPLARWPNRGWTRIAAVPEGPKGERFRYEGDRPARWKKSEDIWVHGYMNRNWCDTYEQVAVLDARSREVITREPHDYRGYKAGQRFLFLNVLEELDEAGEWYLDRAAGILYFWPPGPIAQGRVCVSVLEAPLVALRRTEHVTLRGLFLECTRGCGVEIIGGSHNRVAGCTLRNIGTVGVTIGVVEPDLERRVYLDTTFGGDAGTDNGVIACEIHDTGEYGIILAGGDRRTLEPGGNHAEGNDIHDFGRWVRTYRPAVFLCGVGNRVAHNRLHDAPHTAVLFWGNDHVLEFNEVYRVCAETGDAGAFYIGRDWTQRGNVIRYNRFHDLGATLEGENGFNGVMAVYLDDQASGTTVFGNLFDRINCGVMVGGGRDNTVENNIFASCGRPISLDARGIGDDYSAGNTLFDRLKPVGHDRPPYSERYPRLASILGDDPGQPKGNEISRNISVGGPWEVFSLSSENEFVRKLVKMEGNLTEGDPGLVAPEKGDFRLRADSPALKLGFKPIPFDRIGPSPDVDR